MTETDDYIRNIVDNLLVSFPEGININNVTDVIINCMKLVSKVPSLTGIEKKKLVIDSCFYFIENHDAGTYNSQIDSVLKFLLPKIIDQFILIEDGKIKFNKPTISSSLFSCCKPK